jgi:hypothetical protein
MGIDSMDEVRCPMCSKKNPADAETCEFCGARIKPLIIQSPSQETPAEKESIIPSRVDQPVEKPTEQPVEQPEDIAEDQEQSSQETDWLTRMRFEVKDEEEEELELPEADEGPKRGETDLLGRFKDLGISSDEKDLVFEDQSIRELIEEPTKLETELPHEPESISERDRLFPQSDAELEKSPSLHDEIISESLDEEIQGEEIQEAEVPDDTAVPDWLARIRAREEAEKSEPPKRTGDTDWLTGLREVSFAEEDEAEEEEGEGFSGSLDELLSADIPHGLERVIEPDRSEIPFEEKPSSEEDDLISAEASIEDLFSDIDLFEDEPKEIPAAEPSLEIGQPSPEEDDLSDLDNLFEDIKQSASEEKEDFREDNLFGQAETQTAKDIDELFSDEFFNEVKDTAKEDRESPDALLFGEEEAEPAEDEGLQLDADFFADLGIEIDDDAEKVQKEPPISDVVEPKPPSPISDIEPEEDNGIELSGTQDLAPGSDQLAQGPILDGFDSDEIASSLEEIFEEPSKGPASLNDLLGDFSPSWLEDSISDGGGGLPHVPALILDDELPPLDSGEGEGDLASAEIPSWLQDLGRDVDEELIDEEDDIPTLVKATLPPWLEAMRPIETFRTAPDIELELEEEEEIVEAAGPLAGLKGVLLAEPVVAMPRTPISALGTLDISDRELSQAGILQQMVEEEERETSEAEIKHIQLPILRWVCTAVLVLAVIIPTVLGGPTFGSPTRAPSDFSPFLEVVETTPITKPVLLVFDYGPSYSPEMDAVAGALIEDLFARGQTMVTLSTQPLGPMLADRMLRRVGKIHDAVNGVDYLHLGFLSGGPAALQLLASSPLNVLTQGFNLPEEFQGDTVWDSSILSNINQLSDFAMVAVISSGTENAQIWTEQVQPQMGTTPMVMVLSTGIEPIIRPYYESEEPQISGILSGLPSAMIYEERVNGIQADATQRWNGFGLAIVMTVLILLGGAGYGIATWAIQRSRIRQS